MNKEEQDIIVFLEISATTKAKKTIISKEDVKCLLNLIDRLQKENAELKEEIKDLIEENHKHIDYIASMKKKHEDKIRAKIKELENKKEQYSERPLIYNILKSQLEELLGDE